MALVEKWISVDNSVPECVFCCFHFAEACLVRLEEQPVHIGQLYFIIVKKEQLGCHKMRTNHGKGKISTDGHGFKFKSSKSERQ